MCVCVCVQIRGNGLEGNSVIDFFLFLLINFWKITFMHALMIQREICKYYFANYDKSQYIYIYIYIYIYVCVCVCVCVWKTWFSLHIRILKNFHFSDCVSFFFYFLFDQCLLENFLKTLKKSNQRKKMIVALYDHLKCYFWWKMNKLIGLKYRSAVV